MRVFQREYRHFLNTGSFSDAEKIPKTSPSITCSFFGD
jgi:hypothetical protein